jgi:hypothetical protein
VFSVRVVQIIHYYFLYLVQILDVLPLLAGNVGDVTSPKPKVVAAILLLAPHTYDKRVECTFLSIHRKVTCCRFSCVCPQQSTAPGFTISGRGIPKRSSSVSSGNLLAQRLRNWTAISKKTFDYREKTRS